MSASLVFDIYMKEEIIESKVDINSLFEKGYKYCQNMWQCATMTDEGSFLKKMLTNDSPGESCKDFLDEMNELLQKKFFQDEAYSCGECMCFDNDHMSAVMSFVFLLGLFHIVLEYCVQHKGDTITKYQIHVDLLSKCFKLLRGITACNGKVSFIDHFLSFQINIIGSK